MKPQIDSATASADTSKRRRQTASKPSVKTLHPARWADSGPLPWPAAIASRRRAAREAKSAAKAEAKRLAAIERAANPRPKAKRNYNTSLHSMPRNQVPPEMLAWTRATHNLRRYRYKLRKDPTNPTLIKAVQRCINRVEAERPNRIKALADIERNKELQLEAEHRAELRKLRRIDRQMRSPITGLFTDYLAEVDNNHTGWASPQRLAAA